MIRPNRHLSLGLACLMLIALAQRAGAATVTPAQAPLFLAVKASKPNVMLMIDNSGSMNATVSSSTTIAAPAGFTFSCPSAITLAGGADSGTATTVSMLNCNGIPMVVPTTATACTSSDARRFGNVKLARRCFDNGKFYKINATGMNSSTSYSGLALNYYFSMSTFPTNSTTPTSATGGLTALGSPTRATIVKTAANDLVDSLTPDSGQPPTMRVGIADYNDSTSPQGNGGMLLREIKDLDTNHAASLQTAINGITIVNSTLTPLAETLSDIGNYFAGGYTGNLTLKPGQAGQSTATVANVFNNHSLRNATGASSLANPIQNACQRSFVVMMTDGLPTADRDISPSLADYDGDCSGANAANCKGCNTFYVDSWFRIIYYDPPVYEPNHFDMKKVLVDAGKYECPASRGTSDYLDDVAMALHDIDLRPDLTKADPQTQKNNLTIYTIGFADAAVNPTLPGANPLLSNAASKGGGTFGYASGGAQLAGALRDAVDDLAGRVAASASVAANSTRLDNETIIYQAKFDSSDWTGSLLAYPILDSGKTVGTPAWEGAAGIPAPAARTILTYNPTLTGTKGTTFVCANLSNTQKTALGIASCADTDLGVKRLNYLRGDPSNEKRNPLRSTRSEIAETRPESGVFRNRTVLNPSNNTAKSPDPWLLGDIVNSNPVFVGTQNFFNDKLPGTEGSSYGTFRNSDSYKNRTPMLYVGANDGMFHGFDARRTGGTAGKEIVAYVPNAIYGNLAALSDPNYNHNYYVDGSPAATDVYYGGNWRTVVVSTTGAGGKGIFALDITNPSAGFSGSQVLWEISDTDSPVLTDRTATESFAGFDKNLGYTLPKPSIVRMNNGVWATVVANGYGSVNQRAVLYIINVQTGAVIRAIDTGYGSDSAPNGLSAPAPVDVDGNRIVDYIYAGDLQGNVWKFDVRDESPANWVIANSGTPIFVACDQTSLNCPTANRQPISSTVEVGSGPSGGYMVYFGTGKYFESSDNSTSNLRTNTFYAIWDNGTAVASRSSLVAQTITEEKLYSGGTVRLTSNNAVDYSATPAKRGWFMDLLQPPSSIQKGERVVSYPILRSGRVIFTTLLPIPNSSGSDTQCSASDGTGWLMELQAKTGQPLSNVGAPPWDLDGENGIDSSENSADRVPVSGGGYAAPSGVKSKVGIPTAPTIIRTTSGSGSTGDGTDDGCREQKFMAGSDGGLENREESCMSESGVPSGRQSWRQLQ